jgi:hypothetical protein
LECCKVAKFAIIAVLQIRKDDSRNCIMKVLGWDAAGQKWALLLCGAFGG